MDSHCNTPPSESKECEVISRDTTPPQFGLHRNDYIYITPPAGYFGPDDEGAPADTPTYPRGNPMPNRTGNAQKVISWEDPVYLNEWMATIYFFVSAEYLYNRFNAGVFVTDRSINISNLISYVTNSNGSLSGRKYSIVGAFLYGLSNCTWYTDNGSDYGLDYCIFKAGKTLKNAMLVSSGDSSPSISRYGLWAAGYKDDISGGTISISDIVCPWTGDYADAFISNCMSNGNVLTTGAVLNRNIILTIYYLLQSFNGQIIFPFGNSFRILESSNNLATTTWNASITKTLDTSDSNKPSMWDGYIFPSGDTYNYNHGNTSHLSYSVIQTAPYRVALYNTTNVPFSSSTTYSTSTSSTIASYDISESQSISWTSQEGYASTPSVGSWQWSTELGKWVIGFTSSTKYKVYSSSGLNKTAIGTVSRFKTLRFSIEDSAILRHHTKDGDYKSGVYLTPQKFFLLLEINRTYYDYNTNIYRHGVSYGYPTYENGSIDSPTIEKRNYLVHIPCMAKWVSNQGQSRYRNLINSVWEISDMDSIIDECLHKAFSDDFINNSLKIRQSWSDCKFPTIVFPDDNLLYDTTDAHSDCSGSAESSYKINFTIKIKEISAAFQWNPWPSLGVNQVTFN